MMLTHCVEAMAALTGVFFYNHYKNKTEKYFIFFLVGIVICEFIGRYTKYVYPGDVLEFLIGTKFEKNHWWSNIYWVIGAVLFFSFYYRKILNVKIFKSIIKVATFSFLVFSIIYIILNWHLFFKQFFAILDIFGAIVIFLCAVFYFIETLLSEKILTFYRSLNFYISFAIFIWWLIITPLTFYDVYFTYEVGKPYTDWDFVFLRWQIFLFANIFMYSTFTFALIFCKPKLNNE